MPGGFGSGSLQSKTGENKSDTAGLLAYGALDSLFPVLKAGNPLEASPRFSPRSLGQGNGIALPRQSGAPDFVQVDHGTATCRTPHVN
jgi:hypothetical protein